MSDEKFVYVTYIATTPEKVWTALLDGELSKQYWMGHENSSTTGWEKGSKWQLLSPTRVPKVVGQVVENVPQKRLVLSWADPGDTEDRTRQTRVAMDIETVGELVRLTVTHDELYPDMQRRITGGWPMVLSSLKSFLETGRPLSI